jgi:hypothetical protein
VSTSVGSNDAVVGETAAGELDALADGAVAADAVAAGAGAADAVADDADAAGADDFDLVGDGEVDGADTAGACICAGPDCAAGALAPHADSATAAISGSGSSKGNKRRTRPSSQPDRARNHGPPFFPGCVNHPRNDRG